MLARFAHPEADPLPDLAHRPLGLAVAPHRRGDHTQDGVAAALGSPPGPSSSARSPISVSQHPRDPQRTPAPGVDHHVPDFAAIPAVPGHRPPIGDDAGADPAVTVQIDEVVAPGGHAPPMLDERGDLRVIAHGQPAPLTERRPERGQIDREPGCRRPAEQPAERRESGSGRRR